jgi:hypothetical protein
VAGLLALDPAKPRGVCLEFLTRPAQVRRDLALAQQIAEEELEQSLIAVLEQQPVRRPLREPCVQRAPPARRNCILSPRDAAARLRLRLDEAGVRELPQLWIDLAVAGAPEESGRDIGVALDVVARSGSELEHPENHARGRCQVDHIWQIC